MIPRRGIVEKRTLQFVGASRTFQHLVYDVTWRAYVVALNVRYREMEEGTVLCCVNGGIGAMIRASPLLGLDPHRIDSLFETKKETTVNVTRQYF